jgi:hypothetical protein
MNVGETVGESRSVPAAKAGEDVVTHIARTIALHGFDTTSGEDRWKAPSNWSQAEWESRILDVIPCRSELKCAVLAQAVFNIAQAAIRGEQS